MEISKVIYGNTTLIDITDTTATASDVAIGKYFYLSNGEKVQGSYVPASISLIAGSTNPIEDTQHIMPPSGYDGFSYFDVGAIDSNYVGSNVPARGVSDLSASGSVVTVPSGYYSTAVSTAIKGGAVSAIATPSFNPFFNVDSNGVVTVTQNTVTSVLPTLSSGYIDTVSPFTVVVAGSSSYQLSIITADTIDQIVNS